MPTTTGMHWQSMKGGRGHHFEAEREHQPLEAAVVLGGDPVTMLSAILPLPEDMDELSCAGYVRGAPTRFVKGEVDLARGAGERGVHPGGNGAAGRAPARGTVRRPLRALLRGGDVPGLQRAHGDAPA